ncbi:MAG: tRNA uridine(34) 5-carboxymethylaminomethyl modification radical SAM/GNAT enzyme Elp3 [Patescibacteria group bacterium]|nr:tRNA uridine(34) 5-carboxymethylaminomethyl modification radical SAM/GNAT enzyme Elp3 [Patescibacteria group bacterium]
MKPFFPDNFPQPVDKVKKIAQKISIEIDKNKNLNKTDFLTLVKNVSVKEGLAPVPFWALFLVFYRRKKLTKRLKDLLKTNAVRSWSGIVPVSIFTKNFGCPARCVFCPTEARVPKSYFSNEPAVMRAIRNKYDAFNQVSSRLTQLFLSGHSIDKIELIIQGGTFSAINQKYRENFVKRAYEAANNEVEKMLLVNTKHYCSSDSENFSLRSKNKSRSLKKSQEINETAKQRIVGITIETRPDWCGDKEIIFLRKLGVTRVELGAQSLQDDVLDLVKRGHNVNSIIEATRVLKEAGLKVCYHMMPGLPGSTPQKDLDDFKTLFSDGRFQPDLLKIYPCVVTKDAELVNWYQGGKYQPYDDKILTKLLVEIKKIIPPYVRILRLVRDIPANDIIAGSKLSNLRQEAQKELTRQGLKCRCIRCREVALQSQNSKVKSQNYNSKVKIGELILRETEYEASDGKEYFLEYISPKDETLYALLRLRLPSYLLNNRRPLFKELEGAAIVRELHTYGLALPIGKKEQPSPQHKGLGQRLLQKAEEIVKQNNINKIAVTSGVGAREYYRKFGYELQGTYMVKQL